MAVETQVSPTPDASQTATPDNQAPVTVENGTAETSGSQGVSGEAQPTEEQFGGVDIKSLPPELKQKYDAMLRDYKEKTTKLAEERKKFDPISKKAEALDQLLQDQKFIEWYKSTQEPQPAENVEPLSEQEILKRELMAMKTELIDREAKETILSFSSEVDDKGQKLRPDFEELSDIGLIGGYLQIYPAKGKSEFKAKLNEAYEFAKGIANKFKEAGRKQAYEEMQRKAAGATLPPQTGAKGTYDGIDPRKLTAAEAVEYARQGKRVPKY